MTQDELLSQLRLLKKDLSEKFGIQKIALFGSYARNEAEEKSDIDITILQIDEKDYFLRVEAKYFLESLLKKRVDLGYYDSIRPIIQKYIQKDLIVV